MGSYNMQVYDYPEFTQYRIYKRPVLTDEKREKSEYTIRSDDMAERSKKTSHNRTKQSIYELAYNNQWDLFITLTFSPEKADRYNYDEVIAKTTKWLNHLKDRKCQQLKYLIVPEMHNDGAFHIHGLLANCDELPLEDSGRVAIGKKAYVRTDANSHYPTIYNIGNWNWGFSTATKVVDNTKCCSYICKYITKEMCFALKGKHRYMKSNNCKRVEVEKYNCDIECIENMFEEFYLEGLVDYEKTIDVPEAGQSIRYVTVRKNKLENN